MKLILIFIGLSLINVMFSTVRSLVTIKGGRIAASLISGFYFAYYNIVLIYTMSDFPMWQKCLITFGCNVVGVYIIKLIEDKSKKDRLWRIEFTIKHDEDNFAEIKKRLDAALIPFSYQYLGRHTCYVCYCATQKDSAEVKDIITRYNGKYFVSETQILQYTID